MDYITGKTDDMLAVVTAEQRAYTALNFTVQVTNKVVEAYKQIISMQI
ncbi:flagellar hook-basal body complex protein FliE [Tyzzerella sp. OttesenSCG-928-J15]|nr:flagellar hook-basal body complex protein FliE [Tyzzerella sp. OttesenSCG-928-J15]